MKCVEPAYRFAVAVDYLAGDVAPEAVGADGFHTYLAWYAGDEVSALGMECDRDCRVG